MGILTNPYSFAAAAPPASFTNTYSLDFDGVDDYMDIAVAASVISGATGSISFWFKGTSISGGYFFEFKVDANNYFQSYYAYDVLNSTRRAGGSNDSAVSFGGGSGDDGNWHHAAYTWSESADEFISYADGVAETTRTSIGTWAGTPSIFTIAKYSHWSGGYLDGNIDEISIFSSALSAVEIAAIYNSGAPTDLSEESDLIGYWRNGDPDGTSEYPTISDDSTNSNDGTMTNMASGDIVEDVP
jgi:hypothetical protein